METGVRTANGAAGRCRRHQVKAGAGFALRTPFERRYVSAFSASAHPDAVRAFNATPPVARKFFPGARGLYRTGHHYVVAPASWAEMPEGAGWVAVVAHEIGHAVDFHGRGVANGRSLWLAPAIRRDRATLDGRLQSAMAGSREKGDARLALAHFPSAARARLLHLVPDPGAAGTFAAVWNVGRMEEALALLGRSALALRSDREATVPHALVKISDFIGAVYDLERGGGHSRRYYRSFGQILGPALTVGHTAEAFANAFLADVLEGTELLSFLAASSAPATHAAYREILRRIVRGQGCA